MNRNETFKKIDIISYIKLQLSSIGYQVNFQDESKQTEQLLKLSKGLVAKFQENSRLLFERLNPADTRIQNFIDRYFDKQKDQFNLSLPHKTFTLDFKGVSREASLPLGKNHFENKYIKSYRVHQGVLHNPAHDKRTTKNSFHIVEGGPIVPVDKLEVPKQTFAHLMQAALNPPEELLTIPFTMVADRPVNIFASLLLRPIVSPEVQGISAEKSMEVRFFAPGSLICNLDFVESIFGNAGDPCIAENDSALDIDHWTGHTGCIILAPHLLGLRKIDVGLPHIDQATERQKKDNMCYQNESDLYNDGNAYKITCRDHQGVVITIIADNYFGYSKKEIKTQISYSANLYGLCEEEHAGGALVFPRRSIQSSFNGERFLQKFDGEYTFQKVKEHFSDLMNVQKSGYGIDKKFENIIYIPEDADIDIYRGTIEWTYQNNKEYISINPQKNYIFPTGHKLKMEKHLGASYWELISTDPEGTICHKPSTVSGGGKSEISKPITNAIKYGTFYVNNIEEDFETVDKIIDYDYTNRWKEHAERDQSSRPFLSPDRSLGSAIKLLTPSPYYTDQHNKFLESIPMQVKNLAFFVKMFFRDEFHSNWRDYVNTNKVNNRSGHKLSFNHKEIIASHLRVGFSDDNLWSMHILRQDFRPSSKIQLEDDITASITVPTANLKGINTNIKKKSVKLVTNCESNFFQRPDEAINRGYDKEAEADLSTKDNFITNFEPLTKQDAKDLIDATVEFDNYTEKMQKVITDFVNNDSEEFFISSAHPRMVDGVATKNPRYLQKKEMSSDPIDTYLAEIGIRFNRDLDLNIPIFHPVNSVLPSRRNNPRDEKAGIRALSVFSPIHYQELPELFMDFICSLTGKSPSTTGAGSEGALTKGPFNMLSPITDLNNALLSYILTEYDGFTSAAGFIGSKQFDHDISILIPEIWCRLKPQYRNAKKMIKEGSLEKIDDFEYNGEKILASRLGYRITEGFLFRYVNRIFNEPQMIFTEDVMRPEKQSLDDFVDGIKNITEAQKKVALNYFEDGSIEYANPPLNALLNIMAHGHYNNKDITDPEIRALFDRENVIKSSWYKDRLKCKQSYDISMCETNISYLSEFIRDKINQSIVEKENLINKLDEVKNYLKYFKTDDYLLSLDGTIGRDRLMEM